MNAVDTNVLVYLHDPRDQAKQLTAASLVASLTQAVLFWQVACEYIAAARKLKPVGVPEQEIWRNLRLLQRSWRLILPEWSHLDRAEQLLQQRSLSFWDALIIAVALESGVTTLYSEDLSGSGPFPGIQIVNPFGP
jgi:predicted nucleic acid-binding protein